MPRKTLSPPAILHATTTLDGKLVADRPPRLARGVDEETLDGEGCRECFLAGAIDELHLTVLAAIDGRGDAETLSGKPSAEFLPRSVALRLIKMEARQGECVLRYAVRRAKDVVIRS